MHEHHWLAAQFDTHREHLGGVAYRLPGSAAEADDAVQEAWRRVSRTDASVAGTASEVRGAEAWARQAPGGARAFARGLQFVHPIVVNGAPGLVFAPRGRLMRVPTFTIIEDRIVAADLNDEPSRLQTLALSAPQLRTLRETRMKIRLTSIYVDNLDKALRFYTEVLGFVKKTDFSKGPYRWLTVASAEDPDGTELQLALNDSPAAKTYQQAMFQQRQPAAMFFTDDVKGDYERIKARGAEFTMPPTEVTGSTIAQVNDSCGNLIQITQLARW